MMSNHLHVILRNRPDVVAIWSDQEVARRWLALFPGRGVSISLQAMRDHNQPKIGVLG